MYSSFVVETLGRARRFAAQLLGALRFMAQQRIVHCDLKPENILLVEPNKARIKVRRPQTSAFIVTYIYRA